MNVIISLILSFGLIFNTAEITNPLIEIAGLKQFITNLDFKSSDELKDKTYTSTGIRGNALQIEIDGDSIKILYNIGKEITTLDRGLYTLVSKEILSPENTVIVNSLLQSQISNPMNKKDFVRLGGLSEYRFITEDGKTGLAIKSVLTK